MSKKFKGKNSSTHLIRQRKPKGDMDNTTPLLSLETQRCSEVKKKALSTIHNSQVMETAKMPHH
jgi:hypothetical protein